MPQQTAHRSCAAPDLRACRAADPRLCQIWKRHHALPRSSTGRPRPRRPSSSRGRMIERAGSCAPHAGFGHVTVRAHSHAMTCRARHRRAPWGADGGYRPPIRRLGLVHASMRRNGGRPRRARPAPFQAPVAPTPLRASRMDRRQRPANRDGISTSALVIKTATGLRSEASAVRPRRWASSGIDPPPQNGSSTRAGSRRSTAGSPLRASSSTASFVLFSHWTRRSMMPNRRRRSSS